ncbi:hypothetical protein GCM10010421_23340 [Streptomyces glaucus]|uniref:Secreted protein n=1 Tax=Streptomyces glaucus TaxID=284029 RepID=A0ABN3JPE4_9ACTN
MLAWPVGWCSGVRQPRPRVRRRDEEPIGEDPVLLGPGTDSPPAVPAPPFVQGRLTGGLPLGGEFVEQPVEMRAEDPGSGVGTGRTGPDSRHDSPDPCGPPPVTPGRLR